MKYSNNFKSLVQFSGGVAMRQIGDTSHIFFRDKSILFKFVNIVVPHIKQQ